MAILRNRFAVTLPSPQPPFRPLLSSPRPPSPPDEDRDSNGDGDCHRHCGRCYSIGAAATIDAAIWTCCRYRHVWAPIGGVVVDNDTVVTDAPAVPPLLPLGATDPMAAALTKTCNVTAAATAMTMAATAMATEEEECDAMALTPDAAWMTPSSAWRTESSLA